MDQDRQAENRDQRARTPVDDPHRAVGDPGVEQADHGGQTSHQPAEPPTTPATTKPAST